MVTQAGPSGQTEWSHNRLWWVLVGRSSDQRRQVRHPQELRPGWAVFFVVPYLSGTSRYWSPVWRRGGFLDAGCGAGYRLIGLGWRTLFYVYGFLCLSRGPVLVAYFRGFSSLAGVFRVFRSWRLISDWRTLRNFRGRTPYFLAFDAYTEFFLVASALISSSRQLMDCLGLAGPGSGPPHFGILRPSETNYNSLLRVRCRVGSMLSSLLKYRDAHEYLREGPSGQASAKEGVKN